MSLLLDELMLPSDGSGRGTPDDPFTLVIGGKQAPAPPAPTPRAHPELPLVTPSDPTKSRRVAAGLLRGVVGTLEGFFAIPTWAEEMTGLYTPLGTVADVVQHKLQQVQTSLADDPSAPDSLEVKGAEVLGGLLAVYGPGVGLTAATNLFLRQSPAWSRLFGATGTAILQAAADGARTYKDLIPLLGEEEAGKRANTVLAVGLMLDGVTNKLGVFSGQGNAVRRFVMSALATGTQSAAQYDVQMRQFWVPSDHPKAQELIAAGWQPQGDILAFPLHLTDTLEQSLLSSLLGGAIGLSAGRVMGEGGSLLGERGALAGGDGLLRPEEAQAKIQRSLARDRAKGSPVANLPKPTVTVQLFEVPGQIVSAGKMGGGRTQDVYPWQLRWTFNGKTIESAAFRTRSEAKQYIADMTTDFTVKAAEGTTLPELPTPRVGREAKSTGDETMLDVLKRLLNNQTGAFVPGKLVGDKKHALTEEDAKGNYAPYWLPDKNPDYNPLETSPLLYDAFGEPVNPKRDALLPIDYPDHPQLTDLRVHPHNKTYNAVQARATGVVASYGKGRQKIELKDFTAAFPLIEKLPKDTRQLLLTKGKDTWREYQHKYGHQMKQLYRLEEFFAKGLAHKAWYRDALHVARRLFGDDAKLFLHYVAALSPRSQVASNIDQALGALIAHKLGMQANDIRRLIKPGFMHEAHGPNVARTMLAMVDLSGMKVENFRYNLLDHHDFVTIDLWMQRLFGVYRNTDIPWNKPWNKAEKAEFLRQWWAQDPQPDKDPKPYKDKVNGILYAPGWSPKWIKEFEQEYQRKPRKGDVHRTQEGPSLAEYRMMAEWTRRFAVMHNVSPDEAQAAFWAGKKLSDGAQGSETEDDVTRAVESFGSQVERRIAWMLDPVRGGKGPDRRGFVLEALLATRGPDGTMRPTSEQTLRLAEAIRKWPVALTDKSVQHLGPDGKAVLGVTLAIAGALADVGIKTASVAEAQEAVRQALTEDQVPPETIERLVADLPTIWDDIWPRHAVSYDQTAQVAGDQLATHSPAHDLLEQKRVLLTRKKALQGEATPGEYHTFPAQEAIEPDPFPTNLIPRLEGAGETGAFLGEVGGNLASRYTGPVQPIARPVLGAAGAAVGGQAERLARGQPLDLEGAKREFLLSFLPEAGESFLRAGFRSFGRSLSGGSELRHTATATLAQDAAQYVFRPPALTQAKRTLEVLHQHHVGGQLSEARALLDTLQPAEVKSLLRDVEQLHPQAQDALARGGWLSVGEMQQLRESLGTQAAHIHSRQSPAASRRADLLLALQAAIDSDQLAILAFWDQAPGALAARDALVRQQATDRLHQTLTTTPVTRIIRGGEAYLFDLDRFLNLYHDNRTRSIIALKNDLARVPGAPERFDAVIADMRQLLPKGRLTITDTGSLWKFGPLRTVDKMLSAILTSDIGQHLFRQAVVHGRGELSMNTLATIINLMARQERQDPRALAVPTGLLTAPPGTVTVPR